MPLIYRSMFADGDQPRIGSCGKTLGARVPPAPYRDIAVDAQGNVQPKTGGISVAPSLRDLPLHLIPARLRDKAQGARGKDSLVCWSMGEGLFVEAQVSDQLWFRPDPNKPTKHGFVEPSIEMAVMEYQTALANTQNHWRKDED